MKDLYDHDMEFPSIFINFGDLNADCDLYNIYVLYDGSLVHYHDEVRNGIHMPEWRSETETSLERRLKF